MGQICPATLTGSRATPEAHERFVVFAAIARSNSTYVELDRQATAYRDQHFGQSRDALCNGNRQSRGGPGKPVSMLTCWYWTGPGDTSVERQPSLKVNLSWTSAWNLEANSSAAI
jgi:hypothetical protein